MRRLVAALAALVLLLLLVTFASPGAPANHLPKAKLAASTTGICTAPIFTSSTGEASDSMTANGLWWVSNDAWSGTHGPQTISVCSQSSWTASLKETTHYGGVETYPDSEYDVGGRTHQNTAAVGTFSNITSTFAETFPSAGSWDAGYDLWSNYWTTEVMVWNQWAGSQAYWPKTEAKTAVTIGGVGYTFYDNGTKGHSTGELMFFRDTQVTSGSVNLLDVFKWLVTNGYIKSTAAPTELEYGVEVVATSGTEAFPVTGLTMTVNGGGTTPPTTPRATTTTTTVAPPTTTTTKPPPPPTTTTQPPPTTTTTKPPAKTKVTCTGTVATSFTMTCKET